MAGRIVSTKELTQRPTNTLDTASEQLRNMDNATRAEYFAWCAKHRRAPIKQRNIEEFRAQQ